MGAWISYALGSLSENLPTFVVLPDPKGLPYNAKGNFTPGFLPMSHQGTILDAGSKTPVPNLFPAARLRVERIRSRRPRPARPTKPSPRLSNPGDSRLEARIASYELAARMQRAAAERTDLTRETGPTRRFTASTTRPAKTSAADACSPAG